MPRPLTILLSLLTLLSLPLLLATLILWPRSYVYADSFWSNTSSNVRALITTRGHVELYLQHVPPNAPFQLVPNRGHRAQPPSDARAKILDSGLDTAWYFAGFAHAAGPTDTPGHKRIILLPFYFLLILSATPPTLLFLHLRRSRRLHRLRNNLCPRCAYDIRASPDQCPECGHSLPPRPASPSLA